MDPVSMIVEALVAGASLALKDTAGKGVKEAYDGLKALLVKYWKSTGGGDEQENETEAKVLLKNFDVTPEVYKVPLENKLTEIMPKPDPALIEKAQQLHKLLKETGFGEGKSSTTHISHSKNVNTGNVTAGGDFILGGTKKSP